MNPEKTTPEDPPAELKRKFRYMLFGLRLDRDPHDSDSFNYNVFAHLIQKSRWNVATRDAWLECFAMLTPQEFADFKAWLDNEVIPTNYMPYPGAFIVNTADENHIERTKRELKSHLVALHEFVQHYAANPTSSPPKPTSWH